MKNFWVFAMSFCLLLTSSLMVSCSVGLSDEESWDRPIVDWTPVILIFEVDDAAGNDLLDPERADKLIEETTITFKGRTYGVCRSWLDTGNNWDAIPETRVYLPVMKGLQLTKKSLCVYPLEPEDRYVLFFGEIDGGKEMDEDLVLQWSDGKKNTIHYHCSDHKATDKEITVNRWFSLDGKKTESNLFHFVL